MANQLSFVKENGKYYIVGEYPEIPEEFEWALGIGINLKSGGRRSFSAVTARKDYVIPREGAFKKDATGLIDINDIEGFNITIAVRNKEINSHLGKIEIGYLMEGTFNDGTTKRANFIPESAKNQRIPYSDIFNFKKMFQW